MKNLLILIALFTISVSSNAQKTDTTITQSVGCYENFFYNGDGTLFGKCKPETSRDYSLRASKSMFIAGAFMSAALINGVASLLETDKARKDLAYVSGGLGAAAFVFVVRGSIDINKSIKLSSPKEL
jgi:hypothetical protein